MSIWRHAEFLLKIAPHPPPLPAPRAGNRTGPPLERALRWCLQTGWAVSGCITTVPRSSGRRPCPRSRCSVTAPPVDDRASARCGANGPVDTVLGLEMIAQPNANRHRRKQPARLHRCGGRVTDRSKSHALTCARRSIQPMRATARTRLRA